MENHPTIIGIGGTPLLNQEAGIVQPSIADYATSELTQRILEVMLSNQVTNWVNVRRLH